MSESRTMERLLPRLAALGPGRRSGATIRRFLMSNGAGWVLPVALLLLWQVAAEAGLIPPNVLSAPSDVLSAAC